MSKASEDAYAAIEEDVDVTEDGEDGKGATRKEKGYVVVAKSLSEVRRRSIAARRKPGFDGPVEATSAVVS